MKRILCFGDSNTFGYDAVTGSRFGEDIRWTGRLQTELGEEYRVIEEGLGGRTTVFDDPLEGGCHNGLIQLRVCLDSHAPLDIVVIMLGTNDLKKRFGLSAYDVSLGVQRLVEMIKSRPGPLNYPRPKILVISPVPLGVELASSPIAGMFAGDSAIQASRELSSFLHAVAIACGCGFLDAAGCGKPCSSDAVHLDPVTHAAIALAVASKIRRLFYGESYLP
jgi:lysophospholipase L1-like esterase